MVIRGPVQSYLRSHMGSYVWGCMCLLWSSHSTINFQCIHAFSIVEAFQKVLVGVAQPLRGVVGAVGDAWSGYDIPLAEVVGLYSWGRL